MTNEEKYYRRCYKVLKELNEHFKLGISEDKVFKYISKKSHDALYNKQVLKEEDISFILTLLITLMGLNKEDIEEEFSIKYQRNIIDFDIFKIINTEDSKKLKEDLVSSQIVNTNFYNWLYILKTTSKKNINQEILKMIRNGFLHSSFNINYKGNINIINVKNKNYFEANVVYQNFLQFVISYFGNNIGTGLTTNNTLFITNPKINVTNSIILKEYLKDLDILSLVLDNSDNNFFDDILYKNRNIDKELDLKFLYDLNGQVKDLYETKLSMNQINFISDYINTTYGEKFYNSDKILKQNYITELCTLVFNTKNYLSSWILYIFDMFSKISYSGNTMFETSKTNACQEGFYITLALLKSYLVLFRLQFGDFQDINYDYIDIDLNKIEMFKNNNEYFFNIQKRYPDFDNYTHQKIEILQIFRNALSHGNINILLAKDDNSLKYEFLIEFIDEYKTTIRKLYIPLTELNKILDSEAFLPKYCYSDLKTKVKKL